MGTLTIPITMKQYKERGTEVSIVRDTILTLVKVGDTIEITPHPKVPNTEKVFRVDDILEEGFLYGVSETCDGYVIPYSWIKDIKIIRSHSK